jgi:hypothetical protein
LGFLPLFLLIIIRGSWSLFNNSVER